MKILVVEDEPDLNHIITKHLKAEGYIVDSCFNGNDAVYYITEESYDAILLDAMLPGKDGFEVLKDIRNKKIETPVMFLTARDQTNDIVTGLDYGADDYVVKPFSPKELMLRVDAVMKRVKRPVADTGKAPNQIIELDGGGLKADVTARIVYVDGQRVDMSPKEYDLFFYMLENRNIALSREKLISEVWGYDFYGDARTLDTHIKLLRKSLGKYASYIVTLRGVGYRFEEN